MHTLQQSVRAELAAEVLRRHSSLSMRLYGTSMLSSIWPGDVVVFEPCGPAEIELGDVLLYSAGNRLVVHRVIQIRRDHEEFVTRGDNQRVPDSSVNAGQVLGRAVFLRRAGRAPQPILKSRSRAAKFLSWFTARSNAICELALRLHVVRERLASIFLTEPQPGATFEARS